MSRQGANQASASARVGRQSAAQAYETLRADPGARLIDVRTRAEWGFVGMPTLEEIGRPIWAVEWKSFPDMAVNPQFYARLSAQLESDRADGAPATHLLFLCRSGARSMDAALGAAEQEAFDGLSLTNVEDGFEGDLDGGMQRGRVNGWKAAGLPWRQS